MNKKVLLKQLLFIPVFLITGFIAKSQILSEGFEGGTFPPTGWQNVHTAGSNPDSIWQPAATGAFGGNDANGFDFTVDPHAGSGMAFFSSFTFAFGEAAALISPAVVLI